jgi:hypothetical protein
VFVFCFVFYLCFIISSFCIHEHGSDAYVDVDVDVDADAAAIMVMELESRFPPSEVMDALSIVYPQFWLQPGHEDKLTGYMNTLKQTYAHTKDFSSATHVCDTCPAVLSAMALDRQLHWFAMAMANNSPYAMRALDTHIHPLTKLWRALAQSGSLKGMFLEFFKLAEIAMIQVKCYILKIFYFIKLSHAFCFHVFECKLASCH